MAVFPFRTSYHSTTFWVSIFSDVKSACYSYWCTLICNESFFSCSFQVFLFGFHNLIMVCFGVDLFMFVFLEACWALYIFAVMVFHQIREVWGPRFFLFFNAHFFPSYISTKCMLDAWCCPILLKSCVHFFFFSNLGDWSWLVFSLIEFFISSLLLVYIGHTQEFSFCVSFPFLN